MKLAEKLSNEPEAVIPGLPPGANVTGTVTGRNTAGGESAASTPISAVVPLRKNKRHAKAILPESHSAKKAISHPSPYRRRKPDRK